MATYQVLVATGNFLGAGTIDSISLSLVGTKGKSPKTALQKWGLVFLPGTVSCGGRDVGGGVTGTGGGPFPNAEPSPFFTLLQKSH